MRTLLFVCMLVLSVHSSAQIDTTFMFLGEDHLSSEFLINQSPGLINTLSRNGVQSVETSPGQGKQLLLEMSEAYVGTGNFPSLSELRTSVTQFLIEEKKLPLMIMDYHYDRINPWAVDSGIVEVNNNLWYYVDEEGRNPFIKQELFAAFTYQGSVHPGYNSIQLEEEFYFSNQAAPEHKLIDLNDGMGLQPFEWGDSFNLVEEDGKYSIKLEFRRDGKKYKAKAGTPKNFCASPLQPDLPPWTITDPYYPWKFTASFEGEEVIGNAYVKYGVNSSDGYFRKPFIFVEGIDFNITDHYPDRNGDFGWCQFASGTDPDYDFLYNSPVMMDELLDEGYDIILLDFHDGADHVEKNAALLIELIERVNSFKLNDEPNILAGASMGGQITRYALTEMEGLGIPHCTRLWISMDSPHQGAHVPISIQYMLSYLANPLHPSSAQAFEKLETTLRRPAARQFLLQQISSSQPLNEEYYQMMDSRGLPKQSRNVGIANGNGFGLPQNLSESHLLNFNVDFLGDAVAWLRAWPAPGSNEQGDFHLLFSGNLPTDNFQIPQIFGGGCVPTSFYGWNIQTLGPVHSPLEFAPGGTRSTVAELVNEMNEVLADSECGAQEITEFQSIHSFIPTLSALNLSLEEPGLPVSLAESTGADFDKVLYASGFNERHSEITETILNTVMNEVIRGENQLPEVLNGTSPNEGLFNACDPYFIHLRTVSVQDGGSLNLNADQPRFFAEDPDLGPTHEHLRFRTSACGTVLSVGHAGTLEIGDDAGLFTAELNISVGSDLELLSTGVIVINPGSRLTIEKGASFTQMKGRIVLLENAELIIEEGARVDLDNIVKWDLQGDGSKLILGADLLLEQECSLSIELNTSSSVLAISDEVTFLGEGLNVLNIRGIPENRAAVSLLGNSSLLEVNNGFHAVNMKHLRVISRSGLSFSSQSPVNIRDCSILGAHLERAEMEVFAKLRLYTSNLENIQFRADLSDSPSVVQTISGCRFTGESTQLRILGGGLTCSNSDFEENAKMYSSWLDEDAEIRNCEFNGDGPEVPLGIYQIEDVAYTDDSESTVRIFDCRFRNNRGAGVLKQDGDLSLKCCYFENNHSGLVLSDVGECRLSGGPDAGGNVFMDNGIHIQLYGVDELDLVNGANLFGNCYNLGLSGYFNASCACQTHAFFNATGNEWALGLEEGWPEEDKIDLWLPANCNEDPLLVSCPVPLVDNAPSGHFCTSGTPMEGLEHRSEVQHSVPFSISPNPAHATVQIEVTSPTDIWIYDARERLIKSLKLLNNESIDVSEWKSGLYFVHWRSAESQGTEKLMILDGRR